MSTIPFNFSDPDDLDIALASLRCSKPPSTYTYTECNYLSPLQTLATEFSASQYDIENAKELALGCHRDLVVVLLEPTDSASFLPPKEMLKKSPTLIWLDEALRRSSGGARTWRNTRIFDIRPFRNDGWRKGEQNLTTKERLDERAYKAFEEMLRLAKPDVVLTCQCKTSGATNKLAKRLSSSMASSGTLELLDTKTVLVRGFHPSYFTRWEWEEGRELSDSKKLQKSLAPFSKRLLELAILTAINAAAGRSITGEGRYNLSQRSLGRQDVTITFTSEDVASSDLIERLKRLNVGQEDKEGQDLADFLSRLALQ